MLHVLNGNIVRLDTFLGGFQKRESVFKERECFPRGAIPENVFVDMGND
jgi:hypothetical protein